MQKVVGSSPIIFRFYRDSAVHGVTVLSERVPTRFRRGLRASGGEL